MVLPEQLVALLRQPALCHFSTTMPDGSPQITQTWVDTDGEHVVINIVQGMQKAQKSSAIPRLALVVSDPQALSLYYQVRGRAVDVTAAGGAGSIEALSHKDTGAPYAWYGGSYQVRLVVAIKAQRVSGLH
jgi:Pyridoxamine 5'-phosphate oxidase